jgi:hypothetical protein
MTTSQLTESPKEPLAYGGDKITFLPADPSKYPDTTQKISAEIEKYRWWKRDERQKTEDEKERRIKATDEKYAVSKLGTSPTEESRRKNTEDRIAEHKTTLRWYHGEILNKAGWRWPQLRDKIAAVGGVNIVESKVKTGVLAVVLSDSSVVYTILIGTSRFGLKPDKDGVGWGNVYTKLGYEQYHYRTSKQFVKDANGVMTRRYVARAVTIFHIANMVKRAIEAPSRVFDLKNDSDLPQWLQNKVDDVDADPTIKPVESDDQWPRYLGDSYSGHAEVFDLTQAAVLFDADLSKVAPPYKPLETPSISGPVTGLHIRKVTAKRVSTDNMELNEKASMQVRNGSGPVQPFLSAASIQTSSKMIRANKGERFDTGAENQATLELDLSLADREKVKFVNQHAEESNVFKIAYNRYTDRDDIKALQRTLYRWIATQLTTAQGREVLAGLINVHKDTLTASTKVEAVAAELAKVTDLKPEQVGLPTKAFENMNEFERKAVLSLQEKLELHQLSVKREAYLELDEYIYSARKNREVLLNRIPLVCVVRIRFNNEHDKWPHLESYPLLEEAVKSGKFVDFMGIQEQLTAYLTANNNANLKEMFKTAARQKQSESGRN